MDKPVLLSPEEINKILNDWFTSEADYKDKTDVNILSKVISLAQAKAILDEAVRTKAFYPNNGDVDVTPMSYLFLKLQAEIAAAEGAVCKECEGSGKIKAYVPVTNGVKLTEIDCPYCTGKQSEAKQEIESSEKPIQLERVINPPPKEKRINDKVLKDRPLTIPKPQMMRCPEWEICKVNYCHGIHGHPHIKRHDCELSSFSCPTCVPVEE